MTRTIQRLLLASVVLWPTLAVAQTPPPATIEYHHVDALGSIRVVTNASGAVVRTQDYHPFGEGVGAAPNGDPMGFTGKERDAETGLDYFGARYYAQRTGRFTTIDPIYTWKENLVDPQRWNRYAYVRNNPLRYVDPDGRAIETLWDLLNVGLSAKAVWDNPRSGSNWGALALDVGATLIPGAPAIGGTLRVVNKADDITEGGFNSFRAFKRASGAAGDGLDWHHIVEQNARNITEFGEKQIHNIANLMKLDRGVHQQISAFYSSKQEFTSGLIFRDWLRGKSFEEQKRWGEWVLRNVGGPRK